MNFSEILTKSKELRMLKKDLEEDIFTKMTKMGHISSKIRIDSDYIDIQTFKRLTDIEISALEKEYKIRLTLCKKVHYRNIDELISLDGPDNVVFFYTFRGFY